MTHYDIQDEADVLLCDVYRESRVWISRDMAWCMSVGVRLAWCTV
jgi:hypothetical protein